MSRSPLPTLFALSLMACGDGTGPIDYTTLQLSIVAGNAQADTVTKTLPTALAVRVTDASAQPIEGVLVNFVVVEEGCGSAFAPAVLTNALGDASNVWTLGTLAGPCSLEARAINDLGEAVTFDTFTATAMPVAIIQPKCMTGRMPPSNREPNPAMVVSAMKKHGGAIAMTVFITRLCWEA